jgi:hypothetical protein
LSFIKTSLLVRAKALTEGDNDLGVAADLGAEKEELQWRS